MKIRYYREKEQRLFLDIRKGKYSYEEIFEMVDVYEKQFKTASENTELPEEPAYKDVEELMIEIYRKLLG